VESYIVGLEPVPELDQNPAVTVLERASRAVLLRVAFSEVARARRYSRARSHVYDSEAKARQVWRLFEFHDALALRVAHPFA
jgi:hypothetical protein